MLIRQCRHQRLSPSLAEPEIRMDSMAGELRVSLRRNATKEQLQLLESFTWEVFTNMVREGVEGVKGE